MSRKIQENFNFLLSRLLAYVIIILFFILEIFTMASYFWFNRTFYGSLAPSVDIREKRAGKLSISAGELHTSPAGNQHCT